MSPVRPKSCPKFDKQTVDEPTCKTDRKTNGPGAAQPIIRRPPPLADVMADAHELREQEKLDGITRRSMEFQEGLWNTKTAQRP